MNRKILLRVHSEGSPYEETRGVVPVSGKNHLNTLAHISRSFFYESNSITFLYKRTIRRVIGRLPVKPHSKLSSRNITI